ncbi:MAG: arsenate reductase (glutaredoxin) [Pseudomonadales bacterium]
MNTSVTIYHNPRCSKSRQALALLQQRGVEPTIVLYLETPPDSARLQQLLALLGLEARQLLRSGEAPYQELGLAEPSLTDDELIQAMVAHPILIERPIVVSAKGAVLGRPPENVLQLL